MTPTVLNKATAGLLGLACQAVPSLGAEAVVLLPEGPMDWDAVRASTEDVRLIVVLASPRHLESAREAGLIALEAEPTDAAITERISLALIEASVPRALYLCSWWPALPE